MAHTSFFFDLDGTITDSKQGIINSVLYSLNHFGIRASADSLLFFIGPPLKQSFARYFPGDSARVTWKNIANTSGGRGCLKIRSIPGFPRCWSV